MNKVIYAVDVGGTTIKLARFKSGGALEETFEIRTDRSDKGANVFRDLAKAITVRTPDLSSIEGIGVGVPGPVKDTTVFNAVNVGWGTLDVKVKMGEALGKDIPIYVENDANLAALGEYYTHKNISSMVLIALGTGIGGGIITNGTIWTGSNAAAGELGHMKLRTSGNKCACGNIGCFETFSSAKAIRRKAQEQMSKGRDTVMKKADRISAKTVFDAAKMGDELALEIIDKASYYIARAIQIVTVTVDPDVVYIGGGLSKAGRFFIDKIEAHFKRLAFPNVKATPIKQATLVEKANIYGGYALVKHHG